MALQNPKSESDPRVKRTRALLQESLCQLLRARSFEGISVNDIAESATVNRATFYSHYTDKYELLNAMTSTRFQALLDQRGGEPRMALAKGGSGMDRIHDRI